MLNSEENALKYLEKLHEMFPKYSEDTVIDNNYG